MAENTIESASGAPQMLRIGNKVIDLYPIKLKDWPDASKLLYILNFESLADLAYISGLDLLKDLIRIASRAGEHPESVDLEPLEELTDSEFKLAKQILSAQNDIDMDRLLDKVAKVSGKPKNA